MEEQNQKKFSEKYRASIVSVAMMLLLLVAAVICHLFGWRDAPFQFLAACLGAGVTVIITNLLLVEQTKQQSELQDKQMKAEENLQNQAKENELRKIKETEQYKTQLRIYQEYLESVYEVVKDRELTTEEKIQMQFQTAYLAMHTEAQHIEKVSESLKDIFGCLMSPSGNNYNVKALQESLFNIVSQFREELYPEAQPANYDSIIMNFTDAFTPEGDKEDNNEGPELWQKAVKRWMKDDKWELRMDDKTIILHYKSDIDIDIHIQFGFWQEHYYIEAKYGYYGDFSQALKWEYKGRKTYGTWWKHIEDDVYYKLAEGEFWNSFKENVSMQTILIDWFDKLVAFIEVFDVPGKRYKTLKTMIDVEQYKKKGWEFWVYDTRTVVCDSHDKDGGEPYIDTFDENDKIVVRLGNRKENVDIQKQILKRIGLPENKIRQEDGRTIYYDFPVGTPDNEVMAKTAELMVKLAGI